MRICGGARIGWSGRVGNVKVEDLVFDINYRSILSHRIRISRIRRLGDVLRVWSILVYYDDPSLGVEENMLRSAGDVAAWNEKMCSGLSSGGCFGSLWLG